MTRKFATVYGVAYAEYTGYYPSLKEARAAKAAYGDGTESIDAYDVVYLPPRQLAALLLTGESWCVNRVEVEPDTTPTVDTPDVVYLADE